MVDIFRTGWSHWKSWTQGSPSRNILAAIFTVGSFTLAVKILSAGKDVLVARQFGTSGDLDAYLIAFVLPSFAINVIAGSFQAALIPTFIEVREHEGMAAAQTLFSSIVAWSVALLGGATILLALISPAALRLLGSGFDAERLALAQSLLYVMLPSLFLSGLATIWSAVLNAGGRFALAAAAPTAVPVATALFLVFAAGQWGVYALVAGLLAGFAVQAALLAWSLRRHRFSLRPRWSGRTPAMRQVEKQYLPMIAGAFLMGGTDLVDQSMATTLGPGSVSTLNYGYKLVALALNVGALAVGTAVLPYFSQMVARQDWVGLRHTLRRYTFLILLVTIPLTLGVVLLAEPLVQLFFQRGAFTATDTQNVSQVLRFHFLQVPFYVLGILMVRVISALKANHLLMWGSLLNLTTNIFFDYVFMQYFGVSGIALSTSAVYMIACCFFGFMLRRRLRVHGSIPDEVRPL